MSRDLGVRGLRRYWQARQTRPWRAVSWYLQSRGSILCGGLAYTALFSLFAALTIGYAILTRTFGARPEMIDAVFAEVDKVLPGLIDTGSGGVIKPKDLVSGGPLSAGLSVTSIVAAVVLVYTVISFMSALRRSVRIMFGRRLDEENVVQVMARELAAFVAILLAVVVSAAATVIESRFSPVVLGWVGLRGVSQLVATLVGVGATIVINALVVAFVIRVLAGIRPRRRDLVAGCAGAGTAMAGLRYLGSSFVSASANRNVLLASFATLVTILLLVNLTGRVVLMACAWIADPPVTSRYETPVPDEWQIHRGWGSGWPWSPIVRGFRRGKYPRPPG